jgi:hypothetical protein
MRKRGVISEEVKRNLVASLNRCTKETLPDNGFITCS